MEGNAPRDFFPLPEYNTGILYVITELIDINEALLSTYLHIQEWRRLGTPMGGGTKSNGAPLPAAP